MITVYVFWYANVNVCNVWLITSHLKCDMIVYYNLVRLIASYLKCDVIMCYIWLARCGCVLCFVVMFDWIDYISSEMWCDQLIKNTNTITIKRDSNFI